MTAHRRKKTAAGAKTGEAELIYQENILDHYRHPHNAGRLAGPSFKRRETNYSCGDDVELFVKLDAADKVVDAKFDGHGCAISQAATSMLTDSIRGLTKEQLKKLTAKDVLELLGIPIGAGRMRCATLGLKALQAGLEPDDAKR